MMKYSLQVILVLCFLGLTSCSKYYYYHTDCNKNITNSTDKYVYENDTLKLIYEFWDNKGKMSFTIYNKLYVPIFIDWKNSALIINDNKYAYWVEKEIRKGGSVGGYNKASKTYYSAEASIAVKDERVSSIPPHSKIKKTSTDKLRKVTNPKIDGFSMSFRNFLAFSTNEEVKSSVYVDNEFKVVKVEKLKKLPKANEKDFYTIH